MFSTVEEGTIRNFLILPAIHSGCNDPLSVSNRYFLLSFEKFFVVPLLHAFYFLPFGIDTFATFHL